MTTQEIYLPPEEDFDPTPVVPHSKEAEEAVCGSVLIDPFIFSGINQFLKPSHFFLARNRWIWEAFSALEERLTPIDLLTLTDELDHKGLLGEIGGQAYLTALINSVPTSSNAESYARIVESHAIRRQMIAAANRIAQLAYDEKKPIDQAILSAKAETEGLELLKDGHEFIQLGDLFQQTYDDIQERSKNPRDVWGLATGFPKLDKETGGLQLGELTYLPGRPGIGKTWLELGWAIELGKQEPGAIISMEMRKTAIGRRMMSGVSGVSTRAMKSGYLKSEDFPALAQAVSEYSLHPVWIDDGSYNTLQLKSTLARLQREQGIRWFIVDYALLFTDKGKDEVERTALISSNMKRIVQELNLAGIVLHSVTKVGMGAEHEEPEQGEQRGSGQAVFDCDVQLFLTKLYDKDPGVSSLRQDVKDKMATLWCSKGRELEKSKFRINLIRQGSKPFWAEFDDLHFNQSEERGFYGQ